MGAEYISLISQNQFLPLTRFTYPRTTIPTMSGDKVQEGDKVSWSWGSGQPSGTAAEVKAGDVTVVSHRGNEITKHGEEGNPAVHVERSGNDVVEKASELKVESHGSKSNGTSSEPKKDDEKKEDKKKADDKNADDKEDESSEAQAGDKRKADEKADADAEKKAEDKSGEDAKKQKTSNGTAAPAAKS